MNFRLAIAGVALASAALVWGVSNAASPAAPAAAAQAGQSSGSVDNFLLVDHRLAAHELYRLSDAPAVVILTHGVGDAATRSAAKALNAVLAPHAGKGVEVRYLNSDLGVKRDAVVADAKTAGYDMPVLMDAHQLVGEQLGVTRTAEAFVIDPKTWTVVYRGPVKQAAGPLAALVAGEPAIRSSIAATQGRVIAFPERERRAQHGGISFVKDIAPIIEGRCVACHQPGGIGPMHLTSYEQVKGFSPMIREVIRTDRMPPFHADPSVGKFHDDKSLSPAQIKTLVHWIEAGAPRGDGPDPLAAVAHQAPEWPLGKPDVILEIPTYTIPASGIVDYQRPAIPNPLTEGRWLRASTIKVGERQGVHHILTGLMAEMPKDGRASETRWGGSVGGYAVGAESSISPPDVGTYVRAGGAIGFQMHYTPFGKEAVDKSLIGLYFYPEGQKPKMMMRGVTIIDGTISIPPNTEAHKEVAYTVFPKDALLYSAFPHAHYRATASDLTIEYPDGRRELLLTLPKYDFNWQRAYEFEQPIKIPAGSKLIATYTYNNSKRNPANPDPSINVTWGEQSHEEMFFTALRFRWVDETTDDQKNYSQLMQQTRLLGMMDDDVSGKIEVGELRGPQGARLKAAFAQVDANKDGGLDAVEIAKVQSLMGGRPRRAAEENDAEAFAGGGQ